MIGVEVYDQAGATPLAVLENRKRPSWHHVKNAAGAFSVDLPADDQKAVQAILAEGNLLKFSFAGAQRWAGRLDRPRHPVVGEDGKTYRSLSGLGLLCHLGGAVVYPELGFSSSARNQRWFGWQSALYDASAWVAVQGVRQDAPGHIRSGFPPGWVDPAAQWIYPGTPDADVTDWQTTLFRRVFTMSANTEARIYVSADDRYALYLDGELLGQTTLADNGSFSRIDPYPVSLPAGEHVLAASVLNGPDPGGPNPTSLLLTMTTLNPDGTPGTVILRSDTAGWKSFIVGAGGEPGYTGGQIMRILADEAAARGSVSARLTPSFTKTTDTAGIAFTGTIARAFDLTDTYLTVATQLAETAFDFDASPDMKLNLWNGDRGVDRSATVQLFSAVSLKQNDVELDATLATRALVRNITGWQEVADAAGEAAYGRWETGIEVGSTSSDAMAAAVAQASLAAQAKPRRVITLAHSCATGPVPYVDYDMCDRIGVYDEWGNRVSAQVVGITVTEDDDGQTYAYPEVEL